MKKLHLSLDDLRVESFETSAGGATRGTLFANQGSHVVSCNGSCDPTCDERNVSCANTCEATCNRIQVSCPNTCDHTCDHHHVSCGQRCD